MNIEKLKHLLQHRIAAWKVLALFALIGALCLRGCSTEVEYDEMPRAFRGIWDADDYTALEMVRIDARAVTFSYEGGESERCVPEQIQVKRYWASNTHHLSLTCSRKSFPARLRECANSAEYKKYMKWIVELNADSGWDINQLEGRIYQHPCQPESSNLPLLFRR